MTVPSTTAQTPEPAKVAISSLLIAIILGTLFSVAIIGGATYYLARSGRLHLAAGTPATDVRVALQPTRPLVLEPLLVNLADPGGNAYLRVAVTLRVVDVAAKTEPKQADGKEKVDLDKVAAITLRDTALSVLGRQNSGDLLQPDGKERLKSELKKAFADRIEEVKVKDLYFTEFLVQR
jgi:flagellar protein FliL